MIQNPMLISKSMINFYLDTVTVGYFNDHDLPPDDVRVYKNYVQTMKSKALRHGDLEYLPIALAWLLHNEEVNLENFGGGRYPFDASEMREMLSYIYNTLFPDKEMSSAAVLKEVVIVDLSLEDWWRKR